MSQDPKQCRVCDAAELQTIFRQPRLPVLCNALSPSRAEAEQAPVGAMELAFCPDCGMITNVAFDPSRIDYTEAYENALDFSPRFRSYAEGLAQDLVDRHGLRGKTVVEIGCGKGGFLELLCRIGANRGVGFDSSYEGPTSVDCGEGEFRVIKEPFTRARADLAPDLICCRHVLEHIPTPLDFLREVRIVAESNADAVVFFEVPDVRYTLRDLGIWDLIYEHCSYFSGPPLARLFAEAGFLPQRTYRTYGGQFVCLEARDDAAAAWAGPPEEELERLRKLAASFEVRYRKKLDEWNENLAQLFAQGRRIAIWGAGSKGVTFLNNVELGQRIAAVVDINPRKHGRFVPVTGQQVIPPERLREHGVDAVMVMNPLYVDEIGEQLAELGIDAELQVV